MSQINDLKATEIIDSSGNPALKVTAILKDGTAKSASIATNNFPAKYAALDIKDNDPYRYGGHGLLKSIKIIDEIISPRIKGQDCNNINEIDRILLSLDQSLNKAKIGANTLIAVSMAIARVSAAYNKEPLYIHLQKSIIATGVNMPIPVFTMIDGGKNANFNTEFHEFLLMPATTKSLKQSFELGSTVHKLISQTLLKENILPFVGEKGGFGPLLSTNEDGFVLILKAFENIKERLGYDAFFGIDINANTFYKDEHYKIKDQNVPLSRNEFVKFYAELCKKYHILYLEDPLSDEDIVGWSELYSTLNNSTILAGDYLTSTNPLRLQLAISKKLINAIVIKPGNIGTVTEALAVTMMAKAAGLKIIISDNTTTTNDSFLADFAVAVSADYVRFGAPVRGERVAKYNRLIEIENELSKLS